MRRVKTTKGCSVIGIIIADQWDVNGNVTGVAIYSDDEEVYRVDPNQCIKDLLDAIQKKVKATGEIVPLSGGRKGIHIKHIQVVKNT